MVSKEGDPEEFGRLGRAFEGISCNFENWLLMLKSYLEIPNMWSIPTFYPRPYLVFFCFLPANNASSETSLTISPVPNSREVAHRPALGAAHANHYDPQHFFKLHYFSTCLSICRLHPVFVEPVLRVDVAYCCYSWLLLL